MWKGKEIMFATYLRKSVLNIDNDDFSYSDWLIYIKFKCCWVSSVYDLTDKNAFYFPNCILKNVNSRDDRAETNQNFHCKYLGNQRNL